MKKQIKIPEKKVHAQIKRIAIFGSADVDQDHPLYHEVFEIASYLSRQGKVVVNGGGPGVMLAATLGAQAVGGETLTVTFYPKNMPEFEGADQDNVPDEEIKTGNYIERMFGLFDQADAYIIFKGGTGTLSEWSTAWLLAHLYYGNHKPLILYGEFWHEVMEVIDRHFFIDEKEHQVYKIVEDQDGLIKALTAFEQELASRKSIQPTTDKEEDKDV